MNQSDYINTVKPVRESATGKKQQVQEMFDSISGKYDFLNRFLSLGIDISWRKKAITLLMKDQPKHILDVATGTADFAIQAHRAGVPEVTGIDLSEGMLQIGREKLKRQGLEHIRLIQGDSEALPFEDNKFDAVIVAFGVRNFENLSKGLSEMNRVLRPGGRLVVLEFSNPTVFPVKQLYQFYFKYILPFWGRLLSKHRSAYSYLPESVQAFPEGAAFLSLMNNNGFRESYDRRLSFGICSIYTGIK